jgi:prefoldin subunit 5
MASLSREELLALVAELQRQVRALQAQVAQLATDNQELRVAVERLTRQSKRPQKFLRFRKDYSVISNRPISEFGGV